MYGASLEGLDEDLLESALSRAVDQPFGTYTRPLRLESPAREAMPKLLIACSFPLEQVRELIAQGHPWFREMVPSGTSRGCLQGTGPCSPGPTISLFSSTVSLLMRRPRIAAHEADLQTKLQEELP